MTEPGIWIIDPDTNEELFILYKDLEEDIRASLIKPIGGFIFPAGDFMTLKLPEVPFYIKDWLPMRGKSLLYAPPKAGKSILCLQAAQSIASGEDFIGIPTSKGRVLYIQFELGESVLQSRLYQTKKDYDDVFIGTTFSMKLDSDVGQKQLWRAMEAVMPNVLILDPLYKAILGDENEATDVLKILDFLDKVIEGFACSILIIHHSGKELSKHGRGSSVFEDWVDSYIQMQKISKDGERLKIRIKPIFLRHAANPEIPLEAELSDNYEFIRVDSGKTVKNQIADFIKINNEVEVKRIFDAKIGSNTSIYSALKGLAKENVIEKTGWGTYKWK